MAELVTKRLARNEDGDLLIQVGWWCHRGSGHLCRYSCKSSNAPLYVLARDADDVEQWIRENDPEGGWE